MTEPDQATESRAGDASQALERYRAQLESIEGERDLLKAKDRRFGVARVTVFFLAAGLLFFGYGAGVGSWVSIAGWVAMIAFLVVVTLNEPVRDQLELLRRHRAVVRRLIARLERDWDALATKELSKQLSTVELPRHQRDVADDLDLLGRASLFHLVSMAATTLGVRTLAGWLAAPADAEVATERATAIDYLAPQREHRLRFYTLARQISDSSGDPERFVQWAAGKPWLDSRKWLSAWATLSAIIATLLIAGLLVAGFQWLPVIWFKASLVGLVALTTINLLLTAAVLGPAHQIFSIAMANRRAVADYQELFSAAQWLPQDLGVSAKRDETDTATRPGCLARIRHALLDSDHAATIGMQEMQKVAAAGGLRQSAGTFLIYLPLQALGLWDVRVLRRLEQWQAEYGNVVDEWFSSLGELESLISLAALRDEYPDWTSPIWDASGSEPILNAQSIGHPLLSDASRVCNDVTVGPPGTLLLVTGSNMSGKSTMLRSIGLNVALAGTGAPVCATEFRVPSIELATSIRVNDNLSEGVSFYMAELHRLKCVVDQARDMSTIKNRVCLFLLDEILQGTNSRERQIAVVQVLRHLTDSKAIGAISTHDLELADEPELRSSATVVHFREQIHPDEEGNEQMTFDYKMRQGVSPTTNALRLLEMVGLGEEVKNQ